MSTQPRPVVVAPRPWSFPDAESRVLPNGLTVVTYDVPGQYVLSIRIGLPVPLRDEPRDKEGVATITARTLDEGTARHTSAEFARMLERKGVSFGAGMSDSGMSLDLDVVKSNIEPALELLRQILCEPVFPQGEVARHVRIRLAEIDQERATPANRAGIEYVATYYDSADRASRPTGGSRETVRTITRDDVVAFHRSQVVAHGATLVLAGDLEGLDAFALVEGALGGWEPGEDGRPTHLSTPATLAPDRARVVIVDRPGSVQSEILIGCPGPDRSVEGGWAPYPVIGFMLGGSPNARVDAVLREEKGYTYGIRSSFRPRRSGGLFMTSGSVRAETTVESLRLLIDILQSEILIGCPGPDRSVEGGWAPYPVIGFMLGGSPNARVDAVLREEKGYTYGIRSSFRPRRSGGLFMTSGSVRAETTVESLRLLIDILQSGSKGFSEKEVRSGVDFISKTAPGRYATADAIADEAEMMALDGRTTEFTTANLRDLATVDVERVAQSWARFATGAGLAAAEGGWTIVVVGDAATFRDEVAGLGIGPVTVVAGD